MDYRVGEKADFDDSNVDLLADRLDISSSVLFTHKEELKGIAKGFWSEG